MKKFKNKDAYRLVTYYCPYCKRVEYVWNSGDMECPSQIQCAECDYPISKTTRHQGKYKGPQIPEFTPLGIRWFIMESMELYTVRIEKQIEEMDDSLFIGTTKQIVKDSLLSAFSPGVIRLVDPLTLDFKEQIEVLLLEK